MHDQLNSRPATPPSHAPPAPKAAEQLLARPMWRPEEAGHAIPPAPHAVSMALPRWADVVAYEEKDQGLASRLECGYPRFVVHPLVLELARQRGDGAAKCLPFPSHQTARLAAGFVSRRASRPAEVLSRAGVHLVATDDQGGDALKAFWQHTGLIVSSRQAEAALSGRSDTSDGHEARRSLRAQLATWYDCAPEDVFLAPTGMAAQFAALRALMARAPGRRTAQLGFPYVDTLKLQEKLGAGGELLSDLGRMEAALKSLLEREPLAGCFCEVPGNPLLGSADLRRISPILRERHIPLVADDVVATPLNVDLGRHADLVATSLTKFIVGTADAMGGALICNPRSPLHAELKRIVSAQHEELLWGGDAVVLDRQARGFPERMKRHNRNGLLLAERLRAHPAIERVYYPKWEFAEAYEAVRRPEGGYSALITFLPRNAGRAAQAIYDRLPVCKGPSLGTIFTLACPFTLLAHYSELKWAEDCGVSQHLIRISVGLEDPDELWSRIEPALGA